MSKIVTRFAPSPTGWMHIGSLRTALFNYLVARQNNGTFRLRIEDTDQERLVPGAVNHLKKILQDFDIAIDGKIVIQSERVAAKIYYKKALELLQSGHAYYCFCTQERLQKIREQLQAQKQPTRYDGTCRALRPADAQKIQKSGETAVIRLKVPRGKIEKFQDQLRGTVTFKDKDLDDTILIKSNGYPTYHLAHVVDDHDMGITHVIRGEEWLPSAPIHGLIYDYLKFSRPLFYHLPLIVNPDKSKLSKRQGDASVESYISQGYLKEAIINYIAFLGWNPGDDTEILSLDDLLKVFDTSKLHKSPAVFNKEKLNWYNAWYIRNELAIKNDNDLYQVLKVFLPGVTQQKALQIFKLYYQRLVMLSELTILAKILYQNKKYDPQLLIFKKSTREKTMAGLKASYEALLQTNKWTAINLELVLTKIIEESDLQPGDIFWPVRVALSGQVASPSPPELLEFYGKQESLKLVDKAVQTLK